ncbi:MAG: hypothetical protein LBI82_05690 [Dysgonamonadaceae bacterium]|jgi:hypothetical protein|nr:hypothetical protein [Dysgonamonadaceae bacterium]
MNRDIFEFERQLDRLERDGKISGSLNRELRWHQDIYDDFDIERKLRSEGNGVSYSDVRRVLDGY